jgi:hypothetical protein
LTLTMKQLAASDTILLPLLRRHRPGIKICDLESLFRPDSRPA